MHATKIKRLMAKARAKRLERGLKANWVAARLGISATQLCRAELGHTTVGPDVCKAYAKLLGYSVAGLLRARRACKGMHKMQGDARS